MGNRLSELLNSLVDAGWKPFGLDVSKVIINKNGTIKIWYPHGYYSGYNKTLRQIVSKESLLWQFVCKNGMINKPTELFYWQNIFQLDSIEYDQYEYQYRIIESALKEESELEDFLLQNIKIEGGEQKNN